jgi:transcription initiation factor TFIID subunit TAF12
MCERTEGRRDGKRQKGAKEARRASRSKLKQQQQQEQQQQQQQQQQKLSHLWKRIFSQRGVCCNGDTCLGKRNSCTRNPHNPNPDPADSDL